jgi:GNAT superfamily N-acetyltransferase
MAPTVRVGLIDLQLRATTPCSRPCRLSQRWESILAITSRQATRNDIPGMHVVRLAVRENQLTTSGVTEKHYIPAIETTGRGWVIEELGKVIAFAVGNSETGNIWALFVHPDHEGKGYGRALQDVMVSWLFKQGVVRLHLDTEPGTRAQHFYEASGWTFVGHDAAGDAQYERFAANGS